MLDYEFLYQISLALQIEPDHAARMRLLLDRLIAQTNAQRGFIISREDGELRESYQVRFEEARLSADKRRFSRALVREAVRSGQAFVSRDLADDERFGRFESVRAMGSNAVLVAPIQHAGEVQAVIFLEKEHAHGPFAPGTADLVEKFVKLAGSAVYRALEYDALMRFKQGHERDLLARYNFEGIIGRAPLMVSLLETTAQAAASEAAVLIYGETGTGKELIARAVYANSTRRDKAFVTLHCGALPETLFESELFGHKRGAFTGAHSDRRGRIAQADGGTLFIDEVAEIPMLSQAKLLRFFQFGEFQRVGADRVEKVDVRIVAATHRGLEEMVREGSFREDLYYRLNVIELEIPPLRARRGDIPLLLDHFFKIYWRGQEPWSLSAEVTELLETYDYPGNVRELAHIVERICALARETRIEASLLPGNVRNPKAKAGAAHGFRDYTKEELQRIREQAIKQATEEVERRFLEGLLAQNGGNMSQAARAAGFQRTYLHRLWSRHFGSAKTH
ncbi:MAG: sigma-54-dependent Fis family transcriptional regulator [Acidobacteriota bacterium]|nr:sigma-54-dependent Fis family transcriptional regulator [Acidobacteriota bacterium]